MELHISELLYCLHIRSQHITYHLHIHYIHTGGTTRFGASRREVDRRFSGTKNFSKGSPLPNSLYTMHIEQTFEKFGYTHDFLVKFLKSRLATQCECGCVCLCVCGWLCVCLCVCMRVCGHPHTHTHTHTLIRYTWTEDLIFEK